MRRFMEPVRKKPSWVEKQDEGSRRFGDSMPCPIDGVAVELIAEGQFPLLIREHGRLARDFPCMDAKRSGEQGEAEP